MKTYKIRPLIIVSEPKRSISMCAFWRNESEDYQMGSGFLLEYTDKLTNFSETLECLDSDHVWSELKSLGYNKTTRKFITKYC